ncbi:hypothetical protein [Paenibacillus sp. PL91]|uniref:hypothetical protein n=1 Tax=Paenibacillus sp. PL91 TaxID=2729538 RepID=UPI00145EED66|nr:hypothetical protein [Paenibacillus sp. PL91]MBC9204724.1 hypothetical protein [Paenibacillus sp. PL91]
MIAINLFFDPSVLPVITTDIDGNILYVRTYGLHYYGYPDLILEQELEDGEQLILDILDRIFSLDFNITSTWNYNGKLLKFDIGTDGLAHIVFTDVDEARILTILNPITGVAARFISKGLLNLFNHPEAEVMGDVLYGREILGYMMDQVKNGEVYDRDSIITFEENLYHIHLTNDRFGNAVLQIHLDQNIDVVKRRLKQTK